MKLLLVVFGMIVGAKATVPVTRLVEGSYMAKGSGVACLDLAERIDQEKTKLEGKEAMLRQPRARRFKIVETCFVSFKGTEKLSTAVGFMKGVDKVVQDQYFQANQANPTWGLDRIDQTLLPLDNSIFSTEFTGAGVSVYIVDTGVHTEHLEFTGRATFLADTTSEGVLVDGSGHGTHCAGTAAGVTYGVAKEANIFAVKVLTTSGSGTLETIIAGIEQSVAHAGTKPAVISMSLGGTPNDLLDDAVNAAIASGHIVTVSAGNNQDNACGYSPGRAGGNGINGGVITVASTSITDARSSFSSYGSCVDIFAPGTDITSAWIGGEYALNTISGTSMATPHVAGTAATLLEKHNFDRDAAIQELFASAAVGLVTDVQGSPNLLLQVAKGDGTTFPPPLITESPTFGPTVTPGTPTKSPTTRWICPAAWQGASDGCDCECGEYDPDCDEEGGYLFCGGTGADPAQTYCDFETDTCRGRDTLSVFPNKPSSPQQSSSTNVGMIAGVAAGIASLFAIAANFVKRKSTQKPDLSIVGSPPDIL